MTASPSQPCPNCGEPAASPFCPTCGESQTPPLLSVGAWLRETASELLAVDGRVFRTLRALLFSPGTLDQEWARGRRRPYLGPTRLYLIAAAFLFFAAALVPEQGSPIASFASGWMQGGTSDQLSPLAKAEAVDKVAGWVEASLRWLLLFGMVPALANCLSFSPRLSISTPMRWLRSERVDWSAMGLRSCFRILFWHRTLVRI